VLRDNDRRVADDLRDRDGDLVAVQLGRTEVEVTVADPHHDVRVFPDPPAAGALDLPDDRAHPPHRLAAGRRQRGWQVIGQGCELGVRAGGVGERGAVRELFERQPALG
jgi:hypothetical protein